MLTSFAARWLRTRKRRGIPEWQKIWSEYLDNRERAAVLNQLQEHWLAFLLTVEIQHRYYRRFLAIN
jgi:hypothetical protein